MNELMRGRGLWTALLALGLSPGAAPSVARAAPAECEGWQRELDQLHRAGARYFIGLAAIAPAASVAQAQKRAGEAAILDLVQQISASVVGTTSLRETSDAPQEHRASLELTLTSRLNLRDVSTRRQCYDAAKLEYRLLIAVERAALLHTAERELAEHNAEGRQAIEHAEEAMDARDPLAALKYLESAGRELEDAKDEAVVVRALGSPSSGECFIARADLARRVERAREAATVGLVFPPEMAKLEVGLRAMLGQLGIRVVDHRPFVELRGSFLGVSGPVMTPTQRQVFDAVVHVDIVQTLRNTKLFEAHASGRDADATQAAALRRIAGSEKLCRELTRQLRHQLAQLYGKSPAAEATFPAQLTRARSPGARPQPLSRH